MSAYNTLKCQLICPRCGKLSEMAVNLYFGVRDFGEYRLNDPYPLTSEGGSHADYDGEGYAECPVCKGDFFLAVHIRAQRIESAEPDLSKPGYIP
jgi:ribosomal protein S27AE